LPVPGAPLDAQRLGELGADQVVLVGPDGGDDVAHRADPRPFDLCGQDPRAGAQLLAAVQVLVLERGEDAGLEAEPAAHRHALRVAGAGAVEAARERGAPVEHHRLAGVVDHVPPPDVVARGVGEVQAAEEQRGVRVVGQFGDPAGQGTAERLGAVAVAGDAVAGGEEGLGAFAHPA